jgi:hypothetical protein
MLLGQNILSLLPTYTDSIDRLSLLQLFLPLCRRLQCLDSRCVIVVPKRRTISRWFFEQRLF